MVKQGKSPKIDDMPRVTALLFLFFSDHLAVRTRKGPKKEHAFLYFARILRRLLVSCLTDHPSNSAHNNNHTHEITPIENFVPVGGNGAGREVSVRLRHTAPLKRLVHRPSWNPQHMLQVGVYRWRLVGSAPKVDSKVSKESESRQATAPH